MRRGPQWCGFCTYNRGLRFDIEHFGVLADGVSNEMPAGCCSFSFFLQRLMLRFVSRGSASLLLLVDSLRY